MVVHKDVKVAQQLNAEGNLFGNMVSTIAAQVTADTRRTNLTKNLSTLQACQVFIR